MQHPLTAKVGTNFSDKRVDWLVSELRPRSYELYTAAVHGTELHNLARGYLGHQLEGLRRISWAKQAINGRIGK
jgi:hypothetical protein